MFSYFLFALNETWQDVLMTIIFSQICYWFPGKKPRQLVHCYIRGDYFKYKVDIDVTDGGNIHPPEVIGDV
jgi:hypothetical protein